MKKIIDAELLGTVTVRYEEKLSETLITGYIPYRFIINEKNNLDNIRIDLKVNSFNLIKIKFKLPSCFNKEIDMDNISLIERVYNEFNTPIFYTVPAHKYHIKDYFFFDILLPSYFTVRKFLVIYTKTHINKI